MQLVLSALDDKSIKAAAGNAVRAQCNEAGETRLTPDCCVELMALMARATINFIENDEGKRRG